MGIKAPSEREINDAFRGLTDLLKKNVMTAMTKLGEECVARIRNRGASESWIDHTGNLRSSIGYAVYDHGLNYMMSNFSVVLEGNEGAGKGRELVEELARQFTNTYALVVVAGMDYAAYVEAIKNKDVLESTKLWAMGVVKARIDRAIKATMSEFHRR